LSERGHFRSYRADHGPSMTADDLHGRYYDLP
jgi:hypothetical protein